MQRDTDCLLNVCASLTGSVAIQGVRGCQQRRQQRCVDQCSFVGDRIVRWLFMPKRGVFCIDF